MRTETIEVGQVLWLVFRFDNKGRISSGSHPYVIVDINNELGIAEVVHLGKARGKEHLVASVKHKHIPSTNPQEHAIFEDSLAHLDNKFTVELFDGLGKYRKSTSAGVYPKLTQPKLDALLAKYKKYQNDNEIDENKVVHMTREEILLHNQ